jgi:hypothetical protein
MGGIKNCNLYKENSWSYQNEIHLLKSVTSRNKVSEFHSMWGLLENMEC